MQYQGSSLIYVTPLLNTTAARKSMQPAIDFVTARNGTAIVEELPTWLTFFNKYVIQDQVVRRPCSCSPFLHIEASLTDAYIHVYPMIIGLHEQAVGFEDALGTRLLPSRLFSNASARAELSALIADTLPFANPYVIAETPWLYKPAAGTAGATAVTPAWRDAVWLLSITVEFEYNDTLADRTGRYQALSERTQKFRDLAPESGSYFVSGTVLLVAGLMQC